MDERLQNEINKLSSLKQYKGKPQEEILKLAKINVIVREFEQNPLFEYDGANEEGQKKIAEEQAIATERFRDYLENYNIESQADINILRSLVYLEVYERRLQKDGNKLMAEGKGSAEKVTKQMLEVQEQKNILRIKLGIDREKKQDSELTYQEKLEIRFEKHIEEHRNEFTIDVPMICEKCNHEAKYAYLIRRRVKDFNLMKHPWFVGRWFFNLPVIKFVKQGILTKEQAAEILSNASENIESQNAFSKDYCADMIDYCLEHYAEIISINEKLR